MVLPHWLVGPPQMSATVTLDVTLTPCRPRAAAAGRASPRARRRGSNGGTNPTLAASVRESVVVV